MEKIRNFLNKISPVKKAVALGVLAFNPTASGENTPAQNPVEEDMRKNIVEMVQEDTSQPDSTKNNIEWVADSLEKHPEITLEQIQYVLNNPHSKVTSPYEEHRIHPVENIDKPHTGTDFRAPIGTEVLSATNAQVLEVVKSDSLKGGNQVTILTENGKKITYEHLSAITVEVGDTVPAGSIVALSGNSGKGSGPHLHMKVEVPVIENGKTKYVTEDPAIFLNEIHNAKISQARTEEWEETAVNVTRDRMQLP